MRQTLVFMWNSAMRQGFISTCQQFSASIKGFWVWGGDRRWVIILLSFEIFLIFPNFLTSIKSFENSWGNSYIPCLLLLILLRFTCGVKIKSGKVSKKSQSFMSMIVVYLFMFFLTFSCSFPFFFNFCLWTWIFQKQPQESVPDNNGSCKARPWEYSRRCHFVRNLVNQGPTALLEINSFLSFSMRTVT